MMDADGIIKALEQWTGDHGYSTTQALVEPLLVVTVDEVEELLAELTEPEGWITRQSGAIARPRQADDPEKGHVISAELTSGTQSVQLRRLPNGWSLTRITEGKGTEYLCDDIVYATLEDGGARYRRFWNLPDNGAVQVIAWRFVGFEEIA